MAKFDTNFDSAQHEERKGFEPIPAADYPAMITNSTFKPNNAGTGHYLELEVTVLDGDYKGRKIWDRLNLKNPSAQAVEIAEQTLAEVCRATNVLVLEDSIKLHNVPMMVHVKVQPPKPPYDAGNNISKYMRVEGAAAVAQPVPATPAAPATGSPAASETAQPAAGEKPAWAR